MSDDISIQESLDAKNTEKGFPDQYMSKLYAIEEQYLQKERRPDAIQAIRELITSALPENIEELKRYNDSSVPSGSV